MPEGVISGYESLVATLVGRDRLLLYIIIGAVCIAIHAQSRLKITAPSAQEYDFVKLLSLPDIVGRRKYRRLAVLYTLSLEFVYAMLCLMQPLFPKHIGAETPNPFADPYGGASWPLVAALGVIGLLPSVPGFDKLEAAIRNFAFSVNDIPEEFLRRVARLSQSEIKEFLARDQRYKPDLDRYWRVHNLALATGYAPPSAHQVARRVVGLNLFSRWVLENSAVWSEEQYLFLQEVLNIFKPGAQGMCEQVDELLTETSRSKFVDHVMKSLNVDEFRPLTTGEAQNVSDCALRLLGPSMLPPNVSLTQSEIAEGALLARKWDAKSNEVKVVNKRLCGLFSVLALRDEKVAADYINDRSADGDKVLGEMFKLMDRSRNDLASRISNSWFNATLVGVVACLVMLMIFRVGLGHEPKKGNLTPIQRDLFTAVTFGLTAWCAGKWALSIRNRKIERGSWVHFEELHRFRPSQYTSIFLSAYGVGFVLMTCSTIVFTWLNGDGEGFESVRALSFFVLPLVWALIPATAAVALCCLADWVSQTGKYNNIFAVSIALSLSVAFMAFISNLITTNSSAWKAIVSDHTISSLFFTMVGFILFSASMRGYIKEEVTNL